MRFIHGLLVSALFLSETGLPQGQGIVFVEREVRGGKSIVNQVQIDGERMRIESNGPGAQRAFVFDASAHMLRILNYAEKSYIEIRQEDVQRVKQQIADSEEQLKSLPS